jgi:predicted ATPase/DNA-binding SARP family transcriptional activator
MSGVEFCILGPLEVLAGDGAVALDAPKPRALLALLLLHANEPVSRDRLIDDLWAGAPPATAAQNVRTYVFQLRAALGNDAIRTASSGYELRAEPGSIDLRRFEEHLVEARAQPPAAAAETLRKALALWRGPPLAEFAYEPWAQVEIARLEELRVEALEERIDADLALGGASDVVAELEGLVARHPLRERLRGQLMLALYRCGRQADALAAFRDGRRALVAELGIEPGPALRELERTILEQDPGLELRPVPAASTSLRRRPTSFIGRARELRDIRQLLADDDLRLMTLTGAGGSGKTRLALEATTGLDAVVIELAPVSDPGLVASAIADGLGILDRPGRTRAEALIDHLRHRRVLLVLDNFEQLVEAAPLLRDVLATAGGVKLLVTSRTPLGLPEEHVYPVPPLREREAIRLYVERAREAQPDFRLAEANAEAVTDLCGRLDGLPLALELAAARSNVLSPRALLERMGSRLDLLKPLRGAIEWSYDLLEPDLRELFARLGVFVGGFSVEGAEAVGGDLPVDIVDGLQTLLRNNLLKAERAVVDEPRLGMLETIREYALEQLSACGDLEVVRGRHALHFAALAEQAEPGLLGPQQLEWLERLDADRENIRAALSWTATSGETDTGVRIAANLWRYWNFRHHEREARERLERLLAYGTAKPIHRAMGQLAVASLAQWEGDHAKIRAMCEAAIPVLREADKQPFVVVLLGLFATSAVATGDIEEARELRREALEQARASGDRTAQAYALACGSVVLAAVGQREDAERALEDAVDIARQLGNVRSVAGWGMALAGHAILRGDRAQARALFEDSLTIYRRLSDAWGVPMALLGLTYLALEEADLEAARSLLAESLAFDREYTDQPGLADDLQMSARFAAGGGNLRRAVELHASAARLYESTGLQLHAVWWRVWSPDPGPQIAELRSMLGDDAFEQAWSRGRGMTVDEAIGTALEEISHRESAQVQ